MASRIFWTTALAPTTPDPPIIGSSGNYSGNGTNSEAWDITGGNGETWNLRYGWTNGTSMIEGSDVYEFSSSSSNSSSSNSATPYNCQYKNGHFYRCSDGFTNNWTDPYPTLVPVGTADTPWWMTTGDTYGCTWEEYKVGSTVVYDEIDCVSPPPASPYPTCTFCSSSSSSSSSASPIDLCESPCAKDSQGTGFATLSSCELEIFNCQFICEVCIIQGFCAETSPGDWELFCCCVP